MKCPHCGSDVEEITADKEELRKVVLVFKMASGYEKDDKTWDRMCFSRNVRPAKELLLFMGRWEEAADCVQEVYERFTDLGFTNITFDTILKHAPEWKKRKREKEAKWNIVLPEAKRSAD